MRKTKNYTGIIVFTYVLLITFFMFASVTYAAPPHTFSEGEVVSANKMNANFTALDNAVSGIISAVDSLDTTIRENSSLKNTAGTYFSNIIMVACNSNEILTGGICSCDHPDDDISTTYSGTVDHCKVIGNSVLGYCAADVFEVTVWDDKIYGPPITVSAICMSFGSTSTLSPTTDSTESTMSDEVFVLKQALEKRIQEQEKDYKLHLK